MTPLETRSAGMLSVGTCLQCLAGTLSRMSPNRLETCVQAIRRHVKPTQHNGAVTPGEHILERDAQRCHCCL